MSSDEESFSGSDHEEEEQEDQRLTIPEVFNKYREAANALNAATSRLLEHCKAGEKIQQLCALGDKLIAEEIAKPFKSHKTILRGVAFPTCISVDNCVGHFSPEVGDSTVLKNGDLAKIDMGAHLDGFIAVSAYTIVIGHTAEEPITGRKADLICAAHVAADLILKNMKPGKTNTDITEIIKKIGDAFHVNPVEGVLSHQMKKFVIDGPRVILSKTTTDQSVEQITFGEDDVFQIDIVYSTGPGKTREENQRPTIYKRTVDQTYLLKMKASREVFNEINKKYPALPFCIRGLEQKHARFGLSEMEKHNLITAYPVVYEKAGELVAQVKFTVLITPTQTIRTTNQPIPFVKSEYSVDDPELKVEAAEASSSKKKPKNKKPRVEPPVSTTTTTSTEQAPPTEQAPSDPMETS